MDTNEFTPESDELYGLAEGDPGKGPGAIPIGSPGDGPAPTPGHDPEAPPDDWSLWWSTFQGVPGARLHLWRCRPDGLNGGDPALIVTLDDARRLHLDERAEVEAYVRRRFGQGRYRIAARTREGGRLVGTTSQLIHLIEDPTMPALPSTGPVSEKRVATDRELALEVERMRLAAETEREREARRDRTREAREDRRRERETDRDRRREEERKARIEDEHRRADRDASLHTVMLQVLKEVSAPRGRNGDDPIMAALITRMSQPDPLVLKLLDGHGRREEMTDLVKAQADSMRMASTLQTDSLKQVMTASQEVQSHLLRQAAEVAANREPRDSAWDGLGQALTAAAALVAGWRGQSLVPSPPIEVDNPNTSQMPRESFAAPPLDLAMGLRAIADLHRQHGENTDNAAVRAIIARLEPRLRSQIERQQWDQVQPQVVAVLANDPTLATWAMEPANQQWLVQVLGARASRSAASSSAPVLTPGIASPKHMDSNSII